MKTGDTDFFQTLNSTEVVGALAGSAIIAANQQGIITAFTAGAGTLLGIKTGDALYQKLAVLPKPVHQYLSDCLGRRSASKELSFEVHRAGRGPVNIVIKAMPLAAAKGENSGLVAVLHDDTARKQVEQHLRRINTLASIGMLSATMAHEIKNALTASKTFIELLLEKHPADELTDIVRRESHRIDGIVSQMLRFSAPGKGGFSEISLHESLEHTLRLITPKLKSKSVALKRRFGAGNDWIEGDSYQLQQAFVNLFLNSIDAMPFDGVLSVQTEEAPSTDPLARKLAPESAGPCLKLTISDSGEGISPENLAHIFEPFFTTKRTGTGLGLPITRGIIEEHGGMITVESEPQKGTRFTILLPLLLGPKPPRVGI